MNFSQFGFCLLSVLGFLLYSPPLAWAQVEVSIRIEDATSVSGIDFLHSDGSCGKRYVVEPFTGGLALFDYDGDGLIDVYLLNGSPLPSDPLHPEKSTSNVLPKNAKRLNNRLYKNHGNWKFQDVTDQAGVGDSGYGMGVAAGDYDNDGDWDLYVSNYGDDIFYVNNGDGTFHKGRDLARLDDHGKFGAGVCFLDIDGDGCLDIYCANYQKFRFKNHFEQKVGIHPIHPGPRDFPPEDDILFRSSGDGTFEDISESSGIRVSPATGMGVIAADFDGNGSQDIFVANDTYANFLFLNDGKGKFREEALSVGLATDRFGKANGNMGVECADIDRDGLVDVFTTTYQVEMPVLYRQVVSGLFEDSTNRCRIDPALFPHVNWGVGMIDFDNDADKDLLIANGHFMDNIKLIDDRTSLKVRNDLLQNDGKGRFTNVTDKAGDALSLVESSRGAGFDDLDNDGRVDGVILNWNAAAQVLRNATPWATSEPSDTWLEVELVGVESNRSAAGAKVVARSRQGTQTSFIHLGRGYQSHYGTRLHFGFGAETIEGLDIVWPNGRMQSLPITHGNQRILVIEGHQDFAVLPSPTAR